MDAHKRSPEVQTGKAKPLNRKPRRERLSDSPENQTAHSPTPKRGFAPHWESFLNGLDEPVFALDDAGTCYFVNDAFTQLAGVAKSAMLGKKLDGLLMDQGGKRLQFRSSNCLPARAIMRANDVKIAVEVAAHPIRREGRGEGCIVHIRKAASNEERKRLELIGVLASGIAHDLSNILSPILMGTQILREPATPASIAMVVGIIESAAQRGSDILKQLLTCARGTSAEFTRVDTGRLLIEARELAMEHLPCGIRIEAQAPTEKSVLNGDASQLRLMLLCLLEAEADALGADGSLTLHAANALLDASEGLLPGEAEPGSYVRFHVVHWGREGQSMGSPQDPTDRIPTTKTGIRLAMVRAIAQNHRGFVLATSSLSGAEAYIPATEPVPDVNRRVEGEYSGRESILIVDREPGLRRIMNTVLQSAGYKVTVAADLAEAQAPTSNTAEPFAVIIADGSAEVSEQICALRRSNPASRFIFVMKEVGMGDKKELSESEVEAFLMKPYLSQDLLRTVRDVLDRPKSQELAQ